VPAVGYEYEVGAQQFEGARLGFGWQVLRASEASARKKLGTRAPGAEVVIDYNPRRP
jgi:hypothetical protein